MSARALSEERNCSAVMTGPWNIEMLGAREGERQAFGQLMLRAGAACDLFGRDVRSAPLCPCGGR